MLKIIIIYILLSTYYYQCWKQLCCAVKLCFLRILLKDGLFKHLKCLKGIVHPKMKILSSFTHPQVVSNLYECLCSAEHKGRYSEECGKQSSSGAPLTSIVFFSYYRSQWCPKTAWLQTFFKISSFVFCRTKTFIQVWNYLRVSKWQNFHFWVNYPFTCHFWPI